MRCFSTHDRVFALILRYLSTRGRTFALILRCLSTQGRTFALTYRKVYLGKKESAGDERLMRDIVILKKLGNL